MEVLRTSIHFTCCYYIRILRQVTGLVFVRTLLKVGSWTLEGIIILLIYFSKLSESAFYKEISKFQQKVKK